MENYVNFSVEKAVELLAIDSPTGYTHEAEEYVLREFSALGFDAKRTVKGGILIDLGGEDLGAMTPDEFMAKCLMEIATKKKDN